MRLRVRNPCAKVIGALLAVLTIWSGAQAQGRGGGGPGGQGPQPGFIASGVPAMPDPVGPAPKHDLTEIPIRVVNP